MGLFDIFIKSSKDSAPKKSSSMADDAAAKRALAKPTGSKWDLAQQILTTLGENFENPRIKPNQEDDEMELRARIGGMPIRVQLETDMGWVFVEMKIKNRVGLFELQWDTDMGPIDVDDDDDWGDEDGDVRVFVHKNVFLEGSWSEVEESIGTLKSIPNGFANSLYESMSRLEASRFLAEPSLIKLNKIIPAFYEMSDPIKEITALVQVVQDSAKVLEAGSRDLTAQPSVFADGLAGLSRPKRVTCAYCHCQFPLGDSARCENCGAPYSG